MMKLKFEILNKPLANSKIAKAFYNGTEVALRKSFRTNLEKVQQKLEDCDILIKIDFRNSNACISGDNISDEQMKIIETALEN